MNKLAAVFAAVFLSCAAARAESKPCEQVLTEKNFRAAAAALEHQSSLEVEAFLASPEMGLAKAEARKTLEETGDAAKACGTMAARVGFNAKLACVGAQRFGKELAARGWRAFVEVTTALAEHFGDFWRHYVSRQEPDLVGERARIDEDVHKEGDYRGSYGQPVHDTTPKVMSTILFNTKRVKAVRSQLQTIGRPLRLPDGRVFPVKSFEVSPMINVSGMSYPQLTAASRLVLLDIHLSMAKDHGVRYLVNTGEGGPGMDLALLEGNRAQLKREVIEWNVANGKFERGSLKEAQTVTEIDALMDARDKLFAKYAPEDIAKAQIVAQFGSALNGVRGEDFRVDYDLLREYALNPKVAMIQYKLKQAAKRGARVDARKLNPLVSFFRNITEKTALKSPEVNPEFEDWEAIAALITATKLATGKPVSLKFGVGKVSDALEAMKILRDAGALPDHIQLDGASEGFSPGSGNAPPGADTSLPANEAVIVMNAILKKLGVRDQVYLEATGGIHDPVQGVEKLALGADGISGARYVWMKKALGCRDARKCANGSCPWGYTAKEGTMLAISMNPTKIAPLGNAAMTNWWKEYVKMLSETGIDDWRLIREQGGFAAEEPVVRKQAAYKYPSLDEYYDRRYVRNLLRGALTRAEVDYHVYGRR